jgi:hypothetical protein
MSNIFDFTNPASNPANPNQMLLTPQQVASRQAMYDALSKSGSDYSPIQSKWQGFARLGQALQGAFGTYQNQQTQRSGMADYTAQLANVAGVPAGDASIPATPGYTSPTLQASDAAVDAAMDGPQAMGGGMGGGAVPSPGGFLGDLQQFESGGQNIPNVTKGTSSGQAQGYDQITTGTWNDFAPRAGIDLSQFPTPMSAPREVQQQVANTIPMGRWANETLQYLKSKGYVIDPTATLAQNIAANGGNQPPQAVAAINAATAPRTGPDTVSPLPLGPYGGATAFAADGTPVQTDAHGNAVAAGPVAANVPLPPPRPPGLGITPANGDPATATRPSPAVAAALTAAMQAKGAPAPSGGFGLIGSANAAEAPPQDPRLAMAAALSSPAMSGPPSTVNRALVDALSPQAQADPLAAPATPNQFPANAPLPPPRPANLGAPPPPVQMAGGAPQTPAGSNMPPAPAPQPEMAPSAPATAPPPSVGQFAGMQQPGMPSRAALLALMTNPWAPPEAQHMAGMLLERQMPQPPSIVDGPNDEYGNPTKLLFNAATGVTGRLNADGSVTPVGGAGAGVAARPGAAPPPPVGVDPKEFRKEAAKLAADKAAPSAAQQLEFSDKIAQNKEYQEASVASSAYAAMVNQAKLDDPGADVGMIDSYGKINNPGRAVGQGQYSTIQEEVQSFPKQIQGAVQNVLENKGRLTPEIRAQMLDVAKKRVDAYNANAGPFMNNAEGIARDNFPTLSDAQIKRMIPRFEIPKYDTADVSRYKTGTDGLHDTRNGGALVDEHFQPIAGGAPTAAASAASSAASPPNAPPGAPPGAYKATDGKWYAPDPANPGKFLRAQ